eukprot:CAMPEP_0115333610 /NCGR_PEP_ID=MMETSP0270-20121206/87466_1 /TAXON_ID=71861 /ORGANISM="Scrippsiella trochoidea, Strain CCMP3099" /LENGTH=253 /DNA_ID=CAMNT_0002754531 /DNA_START=631 /DNA_END=1392 /DNA_ORIENTATION=+
MRELARIFEFAPPPLLPEIAQFAAFLRGDGSSPDLRAAGALTSHTAAVCNFNSGSTLGYLVRGGVIRYGPAQQCWGLALPSRSFGVYMAKVVQRCCSQIGCGSIHINLRINHMMADKHVTEAAIACVKSQFICRLRTPKCVPLHALNLVANFRRDVHLTILARFCELGCAGTGQALLPADGLTVRAACASLQQCNLQVIQEFVEEWFTNLAHRLVRDWLRRETSSCEAARNLQLNASNRDAKGISQRHLQTFH